VCILVLLTMVGELSYIQYMYALVLLLINGIGNVIDHRYVLIQILINDHDP
jgi:lipoprotein signal peptidase